jgi:hypothetical protein
MKNSELLRQKLLWDQFPGIYLRRLASRVPAIMVLLLILVFTLTCDSFVSKKDVSRDELLDHIYGSWSGMLIAMLQPQVQ